MLNYDTVDIKPKGLEGKINWLLPVFLLLLAIGVMLSQKPQTNQNLSKIQGVISKPQESIATNTLSTEDLTITTLPQKGEINGRVVAEKWAIWPKQVFIELLSASNNEIINNWGCRKEEPKFSFKDIPFGTYKLRISGDGIEKYTVAITLKNSSSKLYQTLALKNTLSIQGIVYDTRGNPAKSIQVVAQFYNEKPGYATAPTIANTNENGEFKLSSLRSGKYEVFAGAIYSPLSKTETITIGESNPISWIQLTVNTFGTATIKLSLKNGEKWDINELKKIRVSAERLKSVPKFQLSVTVEENGIAYFPALPPGHFVFTAYGSSFRRTRLTASILEGQNTDLNIDLHKR